MLSENPIKRIEISKVQTSQVYKNSNEDSEKLYYEYLLEDIPEHQLWQNFSEKSSENL